MNGTRDPGRVDPVVAHELESVVAKNLERHLAAAQEWFPHEYVPWDEASDYVRTPWLSAQSPYRGDVLHLIAYLLIQELATRVSHRNTGRASLDPVCERLLSRIATDENLHMVSIET